MLANELQKQNGERRVEPMQNVGVVGKREFSEETKATKEDKY